MSAPPAKRRLAFALDYADAEAARRGAESVHESVGVLKVGLELFVREGPRVLRMVSEGLDCELFLDLKLHDIPATVERAVASAAQHGVRYLTVHASGGAGMVEAAVRRADREDTGLTILAVTVLTSLDAADLAAQGIAGSAAEHVTRLARMAHSAGAQGFVCSTAEVSRLRETLGPNVALVTPGIRLAGSAGDDQKRTGTPAQAIADGATLLVVGRPIRDAADPRAAASRFLVEIADAGGAQS